MLVAANGMEGCLFVVIVVVCLPVLCSNFKSEFQVEFTSNPIQIWKSASVGLPLALSLVTVNRFSHIKDTVTCKRTESFPINELEVEWMVADLITCEDEHG